MQHRGPRPVNATDRIVVVDPKTLTRGELGGTSKGLADRPASLDGKVLGIVDNKMGSSDLLAAALIKGLRDRFDIADVIWITKSSVSVPPDPDDWQLITEGADVAIALFGG